MPPNSATSRRDSSSQLGADKPSSLLHAKAVSNRVVTEHIWDSTEPHFLVCFTKVSSATMIDGVDSFKSSVVSIFVHEDLGVVVHDARMTDNDVLRLVSVEIPFVVFLKNEDSDEGPSVTINRSVMSDFVGENFIFRTISGPIS